MPVVAVIVDKLSPFGAALVERLPRLEKTLGKMGSTAQRISKV